MVVSLFLFEDIFLSEILSHKAWHNYSIGDFSTVRGNHFNFNLNWAGCKRCHSSHALQIMVLVHMRNVLLDICMAIMKGR